MVERVGLRDVARAAGIAPATVSHALNGTGTISKETAARVRRIAAEMGYRPNRLAAGLRRQRTSTLGVLIPPVSNPFYSKLLEALETAGRTRGYSLIFGDTNFDPALDSHYVDLFLDHRCDGIIVVASSNNLDGVIRAGVPTVLVNAHLPDADVRVPAVEVEEKHGMYSAVAHLIRLGHRRIGLVTFLEYGPRLQGYRRALADAGIAFDPALVVVAPQLRHLLEDAGERMYELLRAHPELTAIAATADVAAIGAIRAAYRLGRRVPDDLAVVGFDDIDLAAMLAPALTTVAQPIDRIATTALDLMLEQIKEGSVALDHRRVRLETRLVVRESCGAQKGG
jgi:DNA-binding LacI/PurR family transcriptional regulator